MIKMVSAAVFQAAKEDVKEGNAMIGTILIPDVRMSYNQPGIINQRGCFYKTVRLYKAITKKEVCSKVLISRQYLGRLEDETGFFSISRQLCSKLNDALQINTDINPAALDDFYRLKNELILSCLSLRAKKAAILYEELISKKDDLENLVCFPEFMLLKMIYHVQYSSNKSEIEDLLALLKKIHHHFDHRTCQIYFVYLALYKIQNGYFSEASELLNEAKHMSSEVQMQAMIQFLSASIALKNNLPLEAIRNTLKAKELFDSVCNYRQSVRCLSHMALIWSQMREYEGACNLCFQAIDAANSIEFNELLGLNYRILTRISVLNMKYNLVYEYANKAASYGEQDTEIDFFVCYAGWKQNRLDEVEKRATLAKLHAKCKNDPYYYLIRLIRRIVREPKEKESCLLKMISVLKNESIVDYSFLRLLHSEMVCFYRQRNNYKPALEHYEKVVGFRSLL